MQTPFWLVTFERLYTPDTNSAQFYDVFRMKIGEWVAFRNAITKLNLPELHIRPIPSL